MASFPNNTIAAVSLTYDDALPVHFEHVAGKHEENNSRATFNTTICDTFTQNHDAWRQVAARGHELGNHSLFHPCRKSDAMSWLEDCYDLKKYSETRFHKELEVANFILRLTDGRSVRSYGNNCCNTTIGSGDYEISMKPVLSKLFGAARGALNNKIIIPAEGYDIYELGHFNGDGKTFQEIKDKIEEAIAVGGWIIFMFHGVGKGTHAGYIDSSEHDALLDWIGKSSDVLWSRPLIEVANWLKM
ncbi:MAG: polysaccharide deacetylase family protein [Puniceicoccaceae bacterium]